MKTLGRHLRLVREYGVVPAQPWRRPPEPARASGWSLVVGVTLALGALFLVGAAEHYALERLGVAR